jgi:hypothetical protein
MNNKHLFLMAIQAIMRKSKGAIGATHGRYLYVLTDESTGHEVLRFTTHQMLSNKEENQLVNSTSSHYNCLTCITRVERQAIKEIVLC